MSCNIELDKQIGAHFTKRDYELILDSLNNSIRTLGIDDPKYKELQLIYDYVNESYEELLEETQKETHEETEDYENQCAGCGEFISSGRICWIHSRSFNDYLCIDNTVGAVI